MKTESAIVKIIREVINPDKSEHKREITKTQRIKKRITDSVSRFEQPGKTEQHGH